MLTEINQTHNYKYHMDFSYEKSETQITVKQKMDFKKQIDELCGWWGRERKKMKMQYMSVAFPQNDYIC